MEGSKIILEEIKKEIEY